MYTFAGVIVGNLLVWLVVIPVLTALGVGR